MKAARTEKLEYEREALEQDFRDVLIDALRECADGRPGLFGVNDLALAGFSEAMRQRFTPAAVGTLAALEERISEVRLKLGYAEPFPLAVRLAVYRKRRDANDPGELRLARDFLAELKVGDNIVTTGSDMMREH